MDMPPAVTSEPASANTWRAPLTSSRAPLGLAFHPEQSPLDQPLTRTRQRVTVFLREGAHPSERLVDGERRVHAGAT